MDFFWTTQKLANPCVRNVHTFRFLGDAIKSLENGTGVVYHYTFRYGWELGYAVYFKNGKPQDFVS